MADLEIQGVQKAFGALEVIKGVSVRVADGEFLALVGPSGCGKSTLLRMIAGLEEVTEGEIIIDGAVVNDLRPKARDIAMVFQSYALYPHMTVRKNLGFSLRLQGLSRGETEGKIADAARILGLEPYLDRLPRQLSGGQRQRVAMGRAIVRDPKVFLFDEPLSNLDAQLRVQMRGEIKDLHRRLKATMVYVTHDQIEAMTMADRIAVLRDGRLEQLGTPLELYDRPDNVFVAGFIGSPSMNFVRGTVVGSGEDTAIKTVFGALLRLDRSLPEGLGEVICGLRPEHVQLSDAEPVGEIFAVEPTGAETHLVVRCGEHSINAITQDRSALRPGDAVGIAARPEAIHLFDAKTEKRID